MTGWIPSATGAAGEAVGAWHPLFLLYVLQWVQRGLGENLEDVVALGMEKVSLPFLFRRDARRLRLAWILRESATVNRPCFGPDQNHVVSFPRSHLLSRLQHS